MSDAAATTTDGVPTSGWVWVLAGGIATVLAGMFMLVFPVLASVSVTLFAGWTLIFTGVLGFVSAITNRSDGGMLVGILLSAITAIAGVMLAFNPLAGTITLTMLVVLWLIVDGVVGTVLSVVRRGTGWGWWLVSSLLSLVLGVVLLGTMPLGAGWIIGTYVGIVMLFRGMMLTAIAFDVRRIAAANARG